MMKLIQIANNVIKSVKNVQVIFHVSPVYQVIIFNIRDKCVKNVLKNLKNVIMKMK